MLENANDDYLYSIGGGVYMGESAEEAGSEKCLKKSIWE